MSLRAFAERLRNRAFLELDLLRWRRMVAPIRRAPRPAPTRTVLICDLMTMFSTAKVEALMAAALAARGARVVVLLAGRNTVLERSFAAVLPEVETVFLDALATPALRAEAAAEADALMAAHPRLGDLLAVEVEGFRIGRNVQSRVVRGFRVGNLDDGNPEHRQAVRAMLEDSLLTRRIGQGLVADLRPDLALFLEKGYTPAGEMFDACVLGGVETVQWLGAPQSDCFLFKRYGLETRAQHPFSLGREAWREALSMPWGPAEDERLMAKLASHYQDGAWYNRQQLQDGKAILEAEDVRRRLGIAPGRKVAVIFAHILYDATFFYGDNLYADYEEWLVETVRGAIANPQLDWVVKVHPVNVWRSRMDGVPMEQLEVATLRRHFGELPPHVRVMPADTDINTFALFGVIDCGLTVRGTIGMELPCYGIPVVTAGTGRYDGHGFTIDPPDRDAFQRILAGLHTVERLDAATVERARRYAYVSFFRRPFPVRTFTLEYARRTFGVTFASQHVTVAPQAVRKWPAAPDMARIAEWMLDERSADLLAAGPMEHS